MANVVDLVTTIEFVDLNPFTEASDPFDGTNQVNVELITDGGDRPTSEPVMVARLDNVEHQASDTISGAYHIIKDDTSNTVVDTINGWIEDSTRVWVKETYRPTTSMGTAYEQIIGGNAGLGLGSGETSQGIGDYFVFMVMFNATEAVPGKLIDDVPTYA